jgi:hypothetical protein
MFSREMFVAVMHLVEGLGPDRILMLQVENSNLLRHRDKQYP